MVDRSITTLFGADHLDWASTDAFAGLTCAVPRGRGAGVTAIDGPGKGLAEPRDRLDNLATVSPEDQRRIGVRSAQRLTRSL